MRRARVPGEPPGRLEVVAVAGGGEFLTEVEDEVGVGGGGEFGGGLVPGFYTNEVPVFMTNTVAVLVTNLVARPEVEAGIAAQEIAERMRRAQSSG